MTLKDLQVHEKAVITKVKGRGAFRKRILEMGFVVGKEVETIRKAPLKDPVEYRIMESNVSLRNSEAELIEVVSGKDVVSHNGNGYSGTIDIETLRKKAYEKGKVINIALVGNPNCGKTTIFNYATGQRERVGNYAGVTVEAKEAKFKIDGYTLNVVDLPGTYSISAYTPEELYVRDYIINHTPDMVVNVLDGSNLERNLYLTTQLIDMDITVVAALNMHDEMDKKGDVFNHEKFGKMVGIPFVPTVGSRGKGIRDLLLKIIDVYEHREESVRHIHINYGIAIERAITKIQDKIKIESNSNLIDRYSSRFLSIKLLEKDNAARKEIGSVYNCADIQQTATNEIKIIEDGLKDDTETIITDARYGFITGALRETYKLNQKKELSRSEKIDTVLTHKFWGIPIFLFFMWMTFYFTFTLGDIPMGWIDSGVEFLGSMIGTYMPQGIFKDLIQDGILGGVGGVIVFLPNIVLLYFFISLMEDTGYLARAVFIMDKAMHKIGLHGKSFIPLLMGFGCNVPAILSSRIIESRRDRMITILINPFMSCSARLTVYVLLISAFFVSYKSIILFSLYMTGVLMAIISAYIFRKTLFKTVDIPFVMELPPYRFPTLKTILRHMWFRASQYLKKVGGVILIGSIVIWALGYFPQDVDFDKDYDGIIEKNKSEYKVLISEMDTPEQKAKLENDMKRVIHEIELEREAERQEKSFIGHIGNFILPIMKPLGFDWKMSVSLLTGVTAKEIVVGTMGVLYQADEGDEGTLIHRLKDQKFNKGERKGELVFTPLIAMSFMVFILIYFPCIGVIAAIKKEANGWRWALFTAFYTTGLAWLMAFLVKVVGGLFV
jgi:ferrous iron transport protein B